MTCEDFLNSYREMLSDLSELEQKVRVAETRAAKMSARYDADPRGGSFGRGVEDAMVAAAELRDQLKAERRKAETRKSDIAAFISHIGNGGAADRRMRKLLTLYYCDLFTWDEVRLCLPGVYRRGDGRVVNRKGSLGISQTSLYRERLSALGKAEVQFRREHISRE